MERNDPLKAWKEAPGISPREEHLRETLCRGKAAWLRQDQDRLLTCREFLWTQLRYTRKLWWGLQSALLLGAWQLLPSMEDAFSRVRSMGVIGCLFVVVMIPELWRNQETGSTQVEAACLYSLRQVYAARITLFGLVDLTLLTLFCLGLGKLGLTVTEVIAQFLLPVTVTACICFSLLCGSCRVRETVSTAACLLWGGLWWLLSRNEGLYRRILPSVWAALFLLALMFLTLAVRRSLRTANRSWEVEFA